MSKVSNKLAAGVRKVKDQESKPAQAAEPKAAAPRTARVTQAEHKLEASSSGAKVPRLATERIWPD